MLDSLGSTSWHNRHLACFRNLDEILRNEEIARPTITIVGPGAVTRTAGWLLNDAERRGRSTVRNLLGDAARYSDQLLRRLPGMPLRSLEPVELEASLTMPHDLIVADRSQRVLAAVGEQLPQARCLLLDISFQPLSVVSDVVIAFNVICRLDATAAAGGMANVAGAVRPGGWLLIDDRSARAHLHAHPRFVPVSAKIHRRSVDTM